MSDAIIDDPRSVLPSAAVAVGVVLCISEARETMSLPSIAIILALPSEVMPLISVAK
jgi:hypothetical protein